MVDFNLQVIYNTTIIIVSNLNMMHKIDNLPQAGDGHTPAIHHPLGTFAPPEEREYRMVASV